MPDATGKAQVSVWDYKKRRQTFTTTVETFFLCLEEAYTVGLEWLGPTLDASQKQ